MCHRVDKQPKHHIIKYFYKKNLSRLHGINGFPLSIRLLILIATLTMVKHQSCFLTFFLKGGMEEFTKFGRNLT